MTRRRGSRRSPVTFGPSFKHGKFFGEFYFRLWLNLARSWPSTVTQSLALIYFWILFTDQVRTSPIHLSPRATRVNPADYLRLLRLNLNPGVPRCQSKPNLSLVWSSLYLLVCCRSYLIESSVRDVNIINRRCTRNYQHFGRQGSLLGYKMQWCFLNFFTRTIS